MTAAILLLGCTTSEPDAAEVVQAESHSRTDRDVLLAEHGWEKQDRWFSFDVSRSIVTEARRRIFFEKSAVTEALLDHGGGVGREAAPMRFRDGTIFVAETLHEDGTRKDTEILRIRSGGDPEFILLDASGSRTDTFAQPTDGAAGPRRGNVPSVCVGCHAGTGYFHPTMSFPNEPADRKIDIDPGCRDLKVVLHFLEGFHRGGGVFAPYGSIWLSKLKSDARSGHLTPRDRVHYEKLRRRYSHLMM